ncbi:hypothetical protein SAMN05518866_1544 [Sphingobium sp. YR768]|nr:hypothetical protein SAMN05518866_1544 [Sphingobium sp. YR768]
MARATQDPRKPGAGVRSLSLCQRSGAGVTEHPKTGARSLANGNVAAHGDFIAISGR